MQDALPVSRSDKSVVWSLWQALIVNHSFEIWTNECSTVITSIPPFPLLKAGLGLLFHVSGN